MYVLNIGTTNIANTLIALGIRARSIESIKTARSNYTGPNGPVEEITLIVTCDISKAMIFELANILGEDCIGAFDVDTQVGALIGPRADAWGPFNPQYFKVA